MSEVPSWDDWQYLLERVNQHEAFLYRRLEEKSPPESIRRDLANIKYWKREYYGGNRSDTLRNELRNIINA